MNPKTKIYISILTISAAVMVLTTAYSQKSSSLFNLTTRINTAGDDYAPSLTKDGSTAVFNSQMPGEKSHNIFICKNKNGLWGDPYPIFAINSDGNDETPFISADGKTIVFSSDRPGGLSSSATSDGRKRITYDLYISRLVSGKWTEPELLKGTVNTHMNERAPGLSANGETLYFTRWPYNNPARAKIYSAKLDGGEFKDVKELPASINSGNYEIGFRPSYKSGRYYFSSRRPGGSGGWDIYYTTISGKDFTKPVNAGKGINTPYDDMYYSESEINTMICSNKAGGYGKFDLYSSIPSAGISTPSIKETVDNRSSVLNITAIDKESGKVLKNRLFRIILMGEREKESVLLRKIEIKTGSKGSFKLYPKDDADSIVIEPVSKEYSGCSVKIDILPGEIHNIKLYLGEKSKTDKKSAGCINAVIKPSAEQIVTLNSAQLHSKTIYYKFNSHAVPTEYIPEIHKLVELMRSDQDLTAVISGYTDAAGPAGVNDKLSMKRAQSAADIFTALDIPESRITVEWFGESKARSQKTGPRYYYLDRKVEIILKK
jgi:outer membrane protein OmpA-like peptidoglycan-associated protein